MPQTLPYDVWTQIASYLDSNVLDATFTLNSAFLHTALHRRYQEAYFGDFSSPQAVLSFKRLKFNSLATYVRCLTLSHGEASSWSAPLPRATVMLGSKLKALGSKQAPTVSQAELVETMTLMTNLTTLTIQSRPAFNILPAVWPDFSMSLRNLVLRISEGPTWGLPDVVCPNLQNFTLSSSCSCSILDQRSPNAITNRLGPYLNLHRLHLRSLSLTVCSNCAFDISRVFHSMQTFPSLETVSLAPYVWFDTAAVGEHMMVHVVNSFLFGRAPGLKHLILEAFSQHHIINFLSNFTEHRKLPNLSTLGIHYMGIHGGQGSRSQFPIDSACKNQLFPYVKAFASSLEKVDISSFTLDLLRFQELVKIFSPRGTDTSMVSPPLRELRLTVDKLDGEVLVCAAKGLPHLKTFSIGYVRRRVGPGWQGLVPPHLHDLSLDELEIYAFSSDLKRKKEIFSTWDLEDLHIIPLFLDPGGSCKRAIADSFSGVKTFNGATREEYLSSRYDRHI